jgi:hypothetical protein
MNAMSSDLTVIGVIEVPNSISNREIFDSCISPRIQKSLLRSIFQNYADSSEYCWRNFSAAQAKDLSGSYRRATIEEEWAGISTLFPEAKVSVRKYKNKTGSFNELTCGVVKVTQSCVSDPTVIPRFAVFRNTMAKNGQYLLFDDAGQNSSVGTASYLYSLLIHGVDTLSRRRSVPAFARIQFPNHNCTKYLDDGIDLFKRFPEIAEQYIGKARFIASPKPQKIRQTKLA